ncbi:MAG: hypothetical protein HQ518_25640 [Rhodopirellula sp.]|nr:hypothetical protein [Rhodopirellula sp.]
MRNVELLKRYPNRHRTGRHSDPAVDGFRTAKVVMPRPLPLERRNDALARGVLKLRRVRWRGQSGSAGAAVLA